MSWALYENLLCSEKWHKKIKVVVDSNTFLKQLINRLYTIGNDFMRKIVDGLFQKRQNADAPKHVNLET